MTLCRFPYQGGYNFDVHGISLEDRSGGLANVLGRAIATRVAGTADAWTSKTVLDLVRAVRVEVAAKVQ